MQLAFDIYEAIRDFLELGGPVLVVIAWTIFTMWALILERVWFLHSRLGELTSGALAAWKARPHHQSWEAFRIRELFISNVKIAASARLPMIKTLVALCPLLGLLGTVTGMIKVFDVMAVTGTGAAGRTGRSICSRTRCAQTREAINMRSLFESVRLARVDNVSVATQDL
jgi:biopolymer transport protein ExbB